MTATVLDGNDPHLLFTNEVVDAVKLEARQAGAAHVGKAYTVSQGIVSQGLDRRIQFIKEVIAQTLLALVIPEGTLRVRRPQQAAAF